MTKARVVQFEITGRDAPGLHSFYSNVFGWDLQDTPGGQSSSYKRTSADDTGLPGAIGPTRSGPNATREPDWDGGSGQLTVYIEVEHIEETLSKAESAGGKIVAPLHEIPGRALKLAFISDPEGHVLGLSEGLEDAMRQAGYTR
jgi:predicted enzyme related to lactoylglutathione lyase